ncbi:tubulin-tyrosine ligase family-domain-containing protein [Blakeslea trispora]|nr:tubulin-tyrosine ligase family-domain-containing protein [Blakeslea trispora]
MTSLFESFVTVHQYQLSTIPKELWEPLFIKLGEDYLDAGNFVELHHGDPLKGYSLHTKEALKKHSEIFLVDHAWTTSPETAKEELVQNTGLLERLENLMDIDVEEAPEHSDDEDSDEDDESNKPSDELIDLVASQANVSRFEAEKALIAENNEVVNAIMQLTIDPEAKAEADRLHDQVMNQVLASGKPQEKEEREHQERLARRDQREKEWFVRRAQAVCQAMWSYLQTYTYSILQQDGQPTSQTAWYINDEVGSALAHSDDPNVVCVPFIFSRGASGMIPYSVFFPIKDIEAGEIMTVDLRPKNLTRTSDQDAYLLAFEDRLIDSIDKQALIDLYKVHKTNLEQKQKQSYSWTSKEAKEALLRHTKEKASDTIIVYTDAPFVQQFLKLDHVKFTDDRSKADIIWISQDFSQWDTLSTKQAINQLPNENCLTFKHQLAQLVQETLGSPDWFLPTYNVMSQLTELAGQYLHDGTSLWITKPWNMARGLGLDITDNLAQLMRQHDHPIPKIAQPYVIRPCLYNGKKFDLRYIVLVRRTEPNLVALVYNMFWTRLANKKFDLNQLSDYESQFTVMNYTDFEMTQLDHKSFIYNIEKQHQIQWEPVQQAIHAAIKDVLMSAVHTSQPLGLADANKSNADTFAMYGFDIMLTDDFKPIVVEVNFSPDCTRPCQYDPEFVNNLFSVVDSRFDRLEEGLKAFTVL